MAAARVDKFDVVENPGQKPDLKQSRFEARLKEEARKYYNLTKATRPRRYYLWMIADLFSKGIHWVDFNPWDASFKEWDQDTINRCMYTPDPFLQYAVEVIASQYTSSNAKPLATSAAKDVKTKAVLRQMQDYAEYLDWEFFQANPEERQTEAKLIPLRGVCSYLDYDYDQGPTANIPQYGPKMGTVCQDCGENVGGQDGRLGGFLDGDSGRDNSLPDGSAVGFGDQTNSAPQTSGVAPLSASGTGQASGGDGQGSANVGEQVACPACGSPNIVQAITGVAHLGDQQVKRGKAVRHVYDPFQVEIYDRRRGIEESPYLIADDICFKHEALKWYPWINAITGQANLGNWNEGFVGLHYLHQLQIMIANTGRMDQAQPDYVMGYGGAYLNELMCWRRRTFLDVATYADWKFEDDTQLPGTDQIVPKGTQVAAVFPAGIVIHQLNSGPIVQVENIDKNKRWALVKYRVASTGLHGTGVSSQVSLNRGIDNATSFGMQALLAAAMGILILDERVSEIPNIPGRGFTIPVDARMPGESIQDLAGHIDTGASQAIQGAEVMRQTFRAAQSDISMTNSPNSSGLTPQGMKTATGVRYQAGAVGTLTAPPLELYAAYRAKIIQQAIELEREHDPGLGPRAYSKTGETAAKWFDVMTMPEDVRIVSAEDSWQPRTMETRRENVGALMQSQVMGQMPPVIEEAMTVFGLGDNLDTYADWAVKGEKRLDSMKQIVPYIEQEAQQMQGMMAQMGPEHVEANPDAAEQVVNYDPADRLIEQAQAAPNPMDDNGAFVKFWLDVYVGDEFDSFSPILQQAVQKLWMAHQQAESQKQAMQQGLAVQAQAPAMQAQQQQAAQASNQQAEQQNVQQQQQVAMDARKEQMIAAREQEGRQADSSEADAQRQHERDMAGREQAHQVELEKIRAKNKSKQAGK